MNNDALISLISVAVGWVLAQGTDVVKTLWKKYQLNNGLLVELDDIESQLQRVILAHTRNLQIYAHKGMTSAVQVPVYNTFYKQKFNEAFTAINREQRISYQLIHSTLDNLNSQHASLEKFLEDFRDKNTSTMDQDLILEKVNNWGDRVIGAYKTAMTTRWLILHHKRQSDSPSLEYLGPAHEAYVKFLHDLDNEVKRIMDEAQKIDKSSFEKIYDPENFRKKEEKI